MKVYIAAPYTKGDVEQNVKTAIACADALCELGFDPYIPHLSHFWHLVSPKPVSFWYNYDLNWLELCDALLRLPGESLGAEAEVIRAKELCIPVYYSIGELLNGK